MQGPPGGLREKMRRPGVSDRLNTRGVRGGQHQHAGEAVGEPADQPLVPRIRCAGVELQQLCRTGNEGRSTTAEAGHLLLGRTHRFCEGWSTSSAASWQWSGQGRRRAADRVRSRPARAVGRRWPAARPPPRPSRRPRRTRAPRSGRERFRGRPPWRPEHASRPTSSTDRRERAGHSLSHRDHARGTTHIQTPGRWRRG